MKDHCKPKPLCQCVLRNCMKCRLQFASFGNRICDSCQNKNRKVGLFAGKEKPTSRRGKTGAE